jgi:hypothetical protein
MDGTYTYADGVITYYPEHSTAPQPDEYIRDFVIRKEKTCPSTLARWLTMSRFQRLGELRRGRKGLEKT